jgi:hypothetical protein
MRNVKMFLDGDSNDAGFVHVTNLRGIDRDVVARLDRVDPDAVGLGNCGSECGEVAQHRERHDVSRRRVANGDVIEHLDP